MSNQLWLFQYPPDSCEREATEPDNGSVGPDVEITLPEGNVSVPPEHSLSSSDASAVSQLDDWSEPGLDRITEGRPKTEFANNARIDLSPDLSGVQSLHVERRRLSTPELIARENRFSEMLNLEKDRLLKPSDALEASDDDQRIYHLEQALDQALLYLDELGMRVKEQRILEEQLASTEDYAYVQYQAIARLKTQVREYQERIAQNDEVLLLQEEDKALMQTNLRLLQQEQLSLRQENAQWKQACQELQQECDRQHRKVEALEQETKAMQEQILQQARQSSEQETAIQYWKDRYTLNQRYLKQLQEIIAMKLDDSKGKNEAGVSELVDLLEMMNSLDFHQDETLPHSEPLSSPQLNALTIADFLIRRYWHRSKSRSDSD